MSHTYFRINCRTLHTHLRFMRRWLAIIVISFGFFSLQGGKIAVYIFCKWQMEEVLQKSNCNCEKHLGDAGGQNGAAQSPAGNLKEKPAEHFVTASMHLVISNIFMDLPAYPAYKSDCPAGFNSLCFHPPA